MNFFTLAFQNLKRHRTRALLTVIAVAISVSVFFSIFSFNIGFERSLKKEIEGAGIHFMVVPTGCPHEVASLILHGGIVPKYLKESLVEEVKDNPKIDISIPIIVFQHPISEKKNIRLIYGIDLSQLKSIKPNWKYKGSFPRNENEIAVGYDIAKHDGVNLGDKIKFEGRDDSFRVTAILDKTGTQEDAFIYMSIQSAKRILKKQDEITAIAVKVKDARNINSTVDELSERIPGIQIVTMNQVLVSISNVGRSAQIVGISISIIALIVSIMGIVNAVLMSVLERIKEFGMMRAVGASRFDIFRIVVYEAVLVLTSGAFIGVFISSIGGNFIEEVLKSIFPYTPSSRIIEFDPVLAIACVMASLFIGILTGFYPAYLASKITPVEAIKS